MASGGADGAAASEDGISFAARLCQRGAAAVIATETSITDMYATKLLARVYGTLARSCDSDVVAAISSARRQFQTELETSTAEGPVSSADSTRDATSPKLTQPSLGCPRTGPTPSPPLATCRGRRLPLPCSRPPRTGPRSPAVP